MGFGFWGFGFGVWGLRFEVWVLGYRRERVRRLRGLDGPSREVENHVTNEPDLWFRVQGLAFSVECLGVGVWGLGFTCSVPRTNDRSPNHIPAGKGVFGVWSMVYGLGFRVCKLVLNLTNLTKRTFLSPTLSQALNNSKGGRVSPSP